MKIDISDPESIKRMYREVGTVEAVVAAGGEAAFGPLEQLSDAGFELSLRSKLMGQVNLVRFGIGAVRDAGSFALTSGVVAQNPKPGSAAISLVNAELEMGQDAFTAGTARRWQPLRRRRTCNTRPFRR